MIPIKTLEAVEKETIVFPGIFLDKYGFDLRGENINDFFKETDNTFIII